MRHPTLHATRSVSTPTPTPTPPGSTAEKGRRPPQIRDGRRQLSARIKPSSVPSRGRIIHLGSPSPATSCGLPGIRTGRATPHPLFGLAPGGVYRATPVTSGPVRSYRTFSPLPVPQAAIGGLFSVALSVASRRPGVTRHPALWSSDFPPAAEPPAILTRTLVVMVFGRVARI